MVCHSAERGCELRLAAAEDQQVGEGVGAGRAAVRAGRQPHRAEQIGELS